MIFFYLFIYLFIFWLGVWLYLLNSVVSRFGGLVVLA